MPPLPPPASLGAPGSRLGRLARGPVRLSPPLLGPSWSPGSRRGAEATAPAVPARVPHLQPDPWPLLGGLVLSRARGHLRRFRIPAHSHERTPPPTELSTGSPGVLAPLLSSAEKEPMSLVPLEGLAPRMNSEGPASRALGLQGRRGSLLPGSRGEQGWGERRPHPTLPRSH